MVTVFPMTSFVFRSVSPFSCNIGSQYLIHTFITGAWSWPCTWGQDQVTHIWPTWLHITETWLKFNIVIRPWQWILDQVTHAWLTCTPRDKCVDQILWSYVAWKWRNWSKDKTCHWEHCHHSLIIYNHFRRLFTTLNWLYIMSLAAKF
jgi:hypothetical protein